MKKNTIKKIAVLTLALAFCSTALMGGTMAKYTSTVEGTGVTDVAKFAYSITAGPENNMTELGAPGVGASLDLFSLREVDTGVNGLNLIAPGTTGSFDLAIENMSDVLVDDEYMFTETNVGADGKRIPVYYTFNGLNYTSFNGTIYNYDYTTDPATRLTSIPMAGDISDLAKAVSDYSDYLGWDAADCKEVYNIEWTWGFQTKDSFDEVDTAIGFAAADPNATAPVLSMFIEGTVTQLDVKP